MTKMARTWKGTLELISNVHSIKEYHHLGAIRVQSIQSAMKLIPQIGVRMLEAMAVLVALGILTTSRMTRELSKQI